MRSKRRRRSILSVSRRVPATFCRAESVGPDSRRSALIGSRLSSTAAGAANGFRPRRNGKRRPGAPMAESGRRAIHHPRVSKPISIRAFRAIGPSAAAPAPSACTERSIWRAISGSGRPIGTIPLTRLDGCSAAERGVSQPRKGAPLDAIPVTQRLASPASACAVRNPPTAKRRCVAPAEAGRGSKTPAPVRGSWLQNDGRSLIDFMVSWPF